jgi:hypothetical protein
MALALNNYVTVPVISTTSPVGIYTAPSGYNAVVLCSQATNIDSSSQDVTLALEREISGIAVTTYSAYQKPIASHSTIEMTTGRYTLNPGDVFKLSASVNGKIHVTITVLETLI